MTKVEKTEEEDTYLTKPSAFKDDNSTSNDPRLFVRKNSLKKNTVAVNNHNHSHLNPVDNPIEYVNKYYAGNRIIKTLNAGISFGELALIDNTLRSTTIVCREDCHFAILGKQDFKRILSLDHFHIRKLLHGLMVHGSRVFALFAYIF